MQRSRAAGGGGSTRPQRAPQRDPRLQKRDPNLGMPINSGVPGRRVTDPGWGSNPIMGGPPGGRPPAGGVHPTMPDLNGEQRGLGYGGMYNKGGYGGRNGAANQAAAGVWDAFNAWTDPNIGGEQPGQLQRGYGGFGALDSMQQTKMNDYLNTLSVGGDRERAMNALGYNNGGNPYVPQVPRGTNQFYRQNARSGQYTDPGIYQHQTAGASADNFNNFGGYTGFTNVGMDGTGQYTPFDVNARGGRLRYRGGTTGTRY